MILDTSTGYNATGSDISNDDSSLLGMISDNTGYNDTGYNYTGYNATGYNQIQSNNTSSNDDSSLLGMISTTNQDDWMEIIDGYISNDV